MTHARRTILVTGAAGFIGSHLVDRLLSSENTSVVGVDNFNDFYDPAIKRSNLERALGTKDFRLCEADITSWGDIDSVCRQNRFDCLVHLAGYAGVRPSIEQPILYEQANVRGTYVVLEAARRHSIPQFIFASSSSIYGFNCKVPFSESDVTDQLVSPYAATKLAGEVACRLYSRLYRIRILCLRFFTVYGARQRPDLAIHKFSRLIRDGKPIQVFGDGTSSRDYTYIDDIIDGVVAALDYQDSDFEVINLGGSQTTELRRLVELLEVGLGRKALIERLPEQPGDLPITYADVAKARALLGYRPATSFEAGLEAFLEWFQGDVHARDRAGIKRLHAGN